MPVYPSRTLPSKSKSASALLGTRRPMMSDMSAGISRIDKPSSPPGAVTAKRLVRKVTSRKKGLGLGSRSKTSSPDRGFTEPAGDPATPTSQYGARQRSESRHTLGTSSESPNRDSPTDWKNLANDVVTPNGTAPYSPSAAATVQAMRTALRDASERLREQDAIVTQSLHAGAMVKVERDALCAQRDELAELNASLRDRIVSIDADLVGARSDTAGAQSDARYALAEASKAKTELRALMDTQRETASNTENRHAKELERATRDAESSKAEARGEARRLVEESSGRVEDANRRAEENTQIFKRDADNARVELARLREDADEKVREMTRRCDEKIKLATRETDGYRNEANRIKQEVETGKVTSAQLVRENEWRTRAANEAEESKAAALATFERDVRDAKENEFLANEKNERVTKELRCVQGVCESLRLDLKKMDFEHRRKGKAAGDFVKAVEAKLLQIEADGPARTAARNSKLETEKYKAENDLLREKLDATRDSISRQMQSDVTQRRELEDLLLVEKASVSATVLKNEELKHELTRWQTAVGERDAAIDALRVSVRDGEMDVEKFRIEALEQRRLQVTATAKAQVALETYRTNEIKGIPGRIRKQSESTFYSVSVPGTPAAGYETPARQNQNYSRENSLARNVSSSPLRRTEAETQHPSLNRTPTCEVGEATRAGVDAFVKTQPREGW